MSNRKIIRCKLVFLGDMDVGKSSIVLRFVKDTFNKHMEPTISAMFLTKKIELEDASVIFEIWDTAGQERFNSILPLYYRNADIICIVYDITSKHSFIKAKNWVEKIKMEYEPKIIVFISNKLDLPVNKRQVSDDIVKHYVKEFDLMYYETSAKTGEGIQTIFSDMALQLCKMHQSTHQSQNYSKSIHNIPNLITSIKSEKSCC